MNSVWAYVGIYLCSVFVASLSQILLKTAANRHYPTRIKEYMNRYVITGYGLLFISTILTMLALKKVPLSWANVIESAGYFFVFIMGYLILKERFSKRKVLGILVIFAGIAVFLL